MKKVFSLLITLAMLISTAVVPMTASAEADVWDGTAADGFASGTGIENDPYIISSAEELAYLASSTYEALSTSTAAPVSATVTDTAGIYNAYTGVYFKLTADIDLGNREWTPIGRFGMRFNGNFDGNGHVVKNLKITKSYFGIGLFGATGINVKITKLGVETANFTYTVHGCTEDKIVSDGDASFSVNAQNDDRVYGTGALTGIFAGGTFEDCFAKNVTIARDSSDYSQSNAGGLLGGPYCTDPTTSSGSRATYKVYVTRCYVNGFTTSGGTITCLGGIAGSATNSEKSHITYGCDLVLDYCYAVNLPTNTICSMADTHYSAGNDDYKDNCYTDKRYSENPSYTVAGWGHLPIVADKAGIVSAIAALDGWSADNEKAPINDGYPVLKWQNTWIDSWDGNLNNADTSWEGEGTSESPYLISSASELAGLAKKVWNAVDNDATDKITDTTISSTIVAGSVTNKAYNIYKNTYFRLTTDIDLNGKEWLPIGRNGARFDGNFDGNGHVVKNIKITDDYVGIGFFGATGTEVKISNLGVENFEASVNCNSYRTTPLDEITEFGKMNDSYEYVWGSGAMVGIYGGGKFENCYTKNAKFTNTYNTVGEAGFGGFAGNDNGIDITSTIFTNCYVIDVTANTKDAAAGFCARVGDETDNRASTVTFTNCYVAGTLTQNKSGGAIRGFAGVSNGKGSAVNCYTTGTILTGDPLTVTSTKAEIESGLVKGDGAFYLDNVSANINNGYPVLAWQRDWTVATSPASFYKVTAHTAADGAVNSVTVIQSDANVYGTVIVAVYDGTRFVNAVTAEATNGAIPVTGLSAVSGNTIKVFVWDSLEGLTPLAAEYSTTL